MDHTDLHVLEAKIKAILPLQYQDSYDTVSPVSMGSAKLIYGPDGHVDWDAIWTHFCDLALAGGPPHRGTLLEPCSAEEMRADEKKYQNVVAEIGRGIWLVTRLPIIPRPRPAGSECAAEARPWPSGCGPAVVAENVMARHDGCTLLLPASPHYVVEKGIKNVIVSLAKTCHYWTGHMGADQQEAVAAIVGKGVLEPSPTDDMLASPQKYRDAVSEIERGIHEITGLETMGDRYPGWIGIVCPTVCMAVWMMCAPSLTMFWPDGRKRFCSCRFAFPMESATSRVALSPLSAWRFNYGNCVWLEMNLAKVDPFFVVLPDVMFHLISCHGAPPVNAMPGWRAGNCPSCFPPMPSGTRP